VLNFIFRRLCLLILLLIPAAGFCRPGELSLSLDALGDAVLAPSNSPWSLGLGASAGLNYRFPDVSFLALGLNLGFNEFPGGTDMQTSWLDLDARLYPFEAASNGEWYLEAGAGPTLLGGVLPNHWAGQYHGNVGIGYLLPIGGNQALDLGLDYDYFNPFNNPLEDVTAKIGICWNLDEAPVQPQTKSEVTAESTTVTSPEATPEPISGTSAESTPTEVPVQWEEDKTISDKLTANIYFGYNHATVMPHAQERMKTLTDLLKSSGDKVELAGYTDNKGEAQINQKLSLSRAESVKAVLVNAGVREDRVTVLGQGMAKPLGDNETPAGRARNRRVEITVLKPTP
jgi:outer membrane protein OmpA-like peptidoglycan-associated protein